MAVIVFTGGATLEVNRTAEQVRQDVERAVGEGSAVLRYARRGEIDHCIVYHQQIAYVVP